MRDGGQVHQDVGAAPFPAGYVLYSAGSGYRISRREEGHGTCMGRVRHGRPSHRSQTEVTPRLVPSRGDLRGCVPGRRVGSHATSDLRSGRLRASRQRYTTYGQCPASMGTRWDGWISPGRISTGYRSAHAPDEGAPGGTTARAVLPSLCVQRRGSDGGNACPPSGWCFWAGARCVAPPRARARAEG